MPPQKISFIFAVTTEPTQRADAAPHSGGWTESMWGKSDVVIDSPSLFRWARLRAAMLPSQCSIVGWRSQLYTVSGNKLLPGGAQSYKSLFPGMAAFTADVPQASLQLTHGIQGRANAVRSYLRGIPDEVVVNGEYAPNARFRKALDDYMKNLILAGGSWASPVRDLTQPQVRVLNVGAGLVTLDAAGGMGVGDYMRFIRVKKTDGKPLSGTFRITAVNGLVFTLAGLDPNINVKPGGLARKDLLVVENYSSTSVGRIGVKKIGSPFEKYRGRRSKRSV